MNLKPPNLHEHGENILANLVNIPADRTQDNNALGGLFSAALDNLRLQDLHRGIKGVASTDEFRQIALHLVELISNNGHARRQPLLDPLERIDPLSNKFPSAPYGFLLVHLNNGLFQVVENLLRNHETLLMEWLEREIIT